jgi:hypothetical protein
VSHPQKSCKSNFRWDERKGVIVNTPITLKWVYTTTEGIRRWRKRGKPLGLDFQDTVYLNLKIITVMNIL